MLSRCINTPLLPHTAAVKIQFIGSYKEVFGFLRLGSIISVCPSVNHFLGHSAGRVVAGGNKGLFERAGERQKQKQHRRRGRHADFILFSFHKLGHSQDTLHQEQRLGSIAQRHLTTKCS